MSTQTGETAKVPLQGWKAKLNRKLGLDKMPVIRKLVYSVIGITVLAIGIAMMILPGPAFIVIPVGLAILASEYAWARRIIRRGAVFVAKVRGRGRKKAQSAAEVSNS